MQGKPTSEARKYLRQEKLNEENRSLEDEVKKGYTLVDTLPFSDLKNYYYTALEQGLEETNLIWMRRETRAFRNTFKSSPLRV